MAKATGLHDNIFKEYIYCQKLSSFKIFTQVLDIAVTFTFTDILMYKYKKYYI